MSRETEKAPPIDNGHKKTQKKQKKKKKKKKKKKASVLEELTRKFLCFTVDDMKGTEPLGWDNQDRPVYGSHNFVEVQHVRSSLRRQYQRILGIMYALGCMHKTDLLVNGRPCYVLSEFILEGLPLSSIWHNAQLRYRYHSRHQSTAGSILRETNLVFSWICARRASFSHHRLLKHAEANTEVCIRSRNVYDILNVALGLDLLKRKSVLQGQSLRYKATTLLPLIYSNAPDIVLNIEKERKQYSTRGAMRRSREGIIVYSPEKTNTLFKDVVEEVSIPILKWIT